MCVRVYVCTCACTCVCACVCAHPCVCMCVCVRTCAHVCVPTRVCKEEQSGRKQGASPEAAAQKGGGGEALSAAPASLPGLAGFLSCVGLPPSPNTGRLGPRLAWLVCETRTRLPREHSPGASPAPQLQARCTRGRRDASPRAPPPPLHRQQSQGTLWRPRGGDRQGWDSRSREPWAGAGRGPVGPRLPLQCAHQNTWSLVTCSCSSSHFLPRSQDA